MKGFGSGLNRIVWSRSLGHSNGCRQEYAKGSLVEKTTEQQREYESRLLVVDEDVPMIEQCYFKFSVGVSFHLALIGCPTRGWTNPDTASRLIYTRLHKPTPCSRITPYNEIRAKDSYPSRVDLKRFTLL